MSRRIRRISRCAVAGCGVVVGLATGLMGSLAQAQGGVISGTVITARTSEPVAGATILIEPTRLGAMTTPGGTYRVTGVPPGTYTITVRRLGYVRATRQVTLRDTLTLNFELEKTATTLDQVVVTGTPTAQSRRELGNALGQVNASELLKVAPKPNVQQLLNVVPGVRVQSGGGDVGSGGNTRIRGSRSEEHTSELQSQ